MSPIPVKLQIPNPISNYSLFNGYTADLFAVILIDAIDFFLPLTSLSQLKQKKPVQVLSIFLDYNEKLQNKNYF